MNRFIRFIIILLLFVAFIRTAQVIFQIYSADESSEKASDLLDKGQYTQALPYAIKAIRLNPLEPKYYVGRARVYMVLSSGEEEGLARTYKVLALEDMKTAYNLNPTNLITIKSLISLYYFLATKNIGEPASVENVDSGFLSATSAFYKATFDKSPNDVSMYVLFYKYANRLNIEDIAVASKSKIQELRPDLLDWYSDLR